MVHKISFEKQLFQLSIPIIIQNLLTTAVGFADTFMLNFVGQDSISAVSLANQMQFLLSLFYLGLTGGTSIMIAQYWGKGDKDNASRIFTIAFRTAFVLTFLFSLLSIFCPVGIMTIFTGDKNLIAIGVEYLRTVGISFVIGSFAQIYLVTLKATQKAARSAIIASITVVTNVILNAMFIFGVGPFPKLGVAGVAIATVIARIMELVICFVDLLRTHQIQFLKKASKDLIRSFIKITAPITLQGVICGSAVSVNASIMGHLNSDVVAANAIAANIQQIATVVCCAFGTAGAILLGGNLGMGQLSLAKENSKKLIRVALISGVISCIAMIACEPLFVSIFDLTDQAKHYFLYMYIILSVNVIFCSYTNTTLCGIFPSGGDTKFGLVCDTLARWGFSILLGYIAAFILHWHPLIVYLILNLNELVKTPFIIPRIRKDTWLHNITE